MKRLRPRTGRAGNGGFPECAERKTRIVPNTPAEWILPSARVKLQGDLFLVRQNANPWATPLSAFPAQFSHGGNSLVNPMPGSTNAERCSRASGKYQVVSATKQSMNGHSTRSVNWNRVWRCSRTSSSILGKARCARHHCQQRPETNDCGRFRRIGRKGRVRTAYPQGRV